jgi:hypothetical protein
VISHFTFWNNRHGFRIEGNQEVFGPIHARRLMMKKLIALGVLGLSIAVAPVAFAGPQQEKMKSCSKQAKEKGLKKAERKAFMKECLSSKPAKAADGAKPAAGK